MSSLSNKAATAAQLQRDLNALAREPLKGTDTVRMIQILSGVLVETMFLFEEPDEALEASLDKLADCLGRPDDPAGLREDLVPPAHVLDFQAECGRAMARGFFEDWLDCAYDFQELILYLIHYNILQWETAGMPRGESFAILVVCAQRALALEISAQELCDLAIERKMGIDGWSLCACISGLSALAGRRLALALSGSAAPLRLFRGSDLPDHLDQIAYVMTQEAIRLGIPAGSDWRFGLAANDSRISAPLDLIEGLEPACDQFFSLIRLEDQHTQAVACAKAAGRMIAVAAGGELPEIEPVIAKPLAMAAMTETYKSICLATTSTPIFWQAP